MFHKKIVYSLTFFLLLGCAAGGPRMTQNDFDTVMVGSSVTALEKERGKPQTIRQIGTQEAEYEYIEKIPYQGRIIFSEKHYFFLIRNGVVAEKRMKEISPPPLYRRDSYEMQTSSNEEP